MHASGAVSLRQHALSCTTVDLEAAGVRWIGTKRWSWCVKWVWHGTEVKASLMKVQPAGNVVLKLEPSTGDLCAGQVSALDVLISEALSCMAVITMALCIPEPGCRPRTRLQRPRESRFQGLTAYQSADLVGVETASSTVYPTSPTPQNGRNVSGVLLMPTTVLIVRTPIVLLPGPATSVLRRPVALGRPPYFSHYRTPSDMRRQRFDPRTWRSRGEVKWKESMHARN